LQQLIKVVLSKEIKKEKEKRNDGLSLSPITSDDAEEEQHDQIDRPNQP